MDIKKDLKEKVLCDWCDMEIKGDQKHITFFYKEKCVTIHETCKESVWFSIALGLGDVFFTD